MDVCTRLWLLLLMLCSISRFAVCQDKVEKGIDDVDDVDIVAEFDIMSDLPEDEEPDMNDYGSGTTEAPEGRSVLGANDEMPSSCSNDTCSGSGECTVKRYEGKSVAVCKCDKDFTGQRCQKNVELTARGVHPCYPDPCRNGGTCRVGGRNTFHCNCQSGYTGTTCAQRSGQPTNPCGICRPGERCQVIGGIAMCSVIPDQGGHACVPNPCSNGRICKLSTGGNGYNCECPPGYTGVACNIRTQPSFIRNTCLPNPCHNGGSCTLSSFGQIQCMCAAGYQGVRCEQRTSTGNPCLPRSPCQNGGTCNPSGSPVCRCVGAYTGTFCEAPPSNPCFPNPCMNSGVCTIKGQSFQCACKPGSSGPRCGSRSGTTNPCYPINPCQNGGVCNSYDGRTYQCQCKPQYSGPRCELRTVPTNPCYSNNPCQNGGQCTSPNGVSVTCRCKSDYYYGDRCQFTRTSISTRCDSRSCLNGGTCINLESSFECRCVTGFTGDNCQWGGVCSVSPCLNGGHCHPTNGGFGCTCVPGWTGDRCQYRTGEDPCSPNPCHNRGFCSALGGSPSCTCTGGYSGPLCTHRNPCLPNPCHNGGFCTPVHNSPSCACAVGYSGPYCSKRNSCIPNPCHNGGLCTAIDSSPSCTCTGGYSGTFCTTRNNPCVPNPCRNGGLCTPLGNTPSCTCTGGYSGTDCTNRNLCVPNPCHNGGFCTLIGNTPTPSCTCVNSYSGPTCMIAPNPCSPNPCQFGGVCTLVVNSGGGQSFSCRCPADRTGSLCEQEIRIQPSTAPCNPNPCQGGCDCVPSCHHANGYYCRSVNGLLGKNCQIPAPTIACGANAITISISGAIVDEYESGIGGFTMSMAQTHSMSPAPTCLAHKQGNMHSLLIPAPFNACGTKVETSADGKTRVSNSVWINKLIGNGVADMPVPIIAFVCEYEKKYSVVTSLQPGIGVIPTITSKGSRTDTATIELCKTGKFCPSQCPAEYRLTQGATYSVGEKLNVRIAPSKPSDHFRVTELFLSCSPDPATTWITAPVVLVVRECLATSTGKYVPTAVKSAMAGVCASFPVPLLQSCATFFIHAKLTPCSIGPCTKTYQTCSGRRKRSDDDTAVKPEVDDNDDNSRIQVFGPILVVQKGVVTSVMYPGKEYLNNSDTGILVLKGDDSRSSLSTSTTIPLYVALSVLLLMAIIIFFVLVGHNWRYINAHCGRRV